MQCNFCKVYARISKLLSKKINLTSWKVQDELIKTSADLVAETIVGKIFDTGHFAKMVDEVRSHKQEQLSSVTRGGGGVRC
jgi:hypothetical protein